MGLSGKSARPLPNRSDTEHPPHRSLAFAAPSTLLCTTKLFSCGTHDTISSIFGTRCLPNFPRNHIVKWSACQLEQTSREVDPITQAPLGTPQVICFGEILHDLLSRSPDADISDLSEWEAYTGGAPANVAACLAALGTPVAYIGNVGDDETGVDCIKTLRDRNVDISGVNVLPSRSTRRVFVRRREGERSFVGFAGDNTEFADTVELDVETLPGVLFYASRAFVSGTLSLAFPGSAHSLRETIKMAQMCKLMILLDVNWRDKMWANVSSDEARSKIMDVLKCADIVKASLEDIEFLLGKEAADRAFDDPFATSKQIGGGKRGIIVTGGGEGVSYAFWEEDAKTPVVARKIKATPPPGGVVDTTGAGDALVAAFLSELLVQGGQAVLTDPQAIEKIMSFAVKVASVVVSGTGAMDPLQSREQVLSLTGDPTH